MSLQENRPIEYTSTKRAEKPEVNRNNGDLGASYTVTDPVKHSTLTNIGWTNKNSEEDISTAGYEREEDNMLSNTVFTRR